MGVTGTKALPDVDLGMVEASEASDIPFDLEQVTKAQARQAMINYISHGGNVGAAVGPLGRAGGGPGHCGA